MDKYDIQGTLAEDRTVLEGVADIVAWPTHRIRLDPEAYSEELEIFVARTRNVIVTSCYLPIDLASSRLMINQSYHDIIFWFPEARPKFDGENFLLASAPLTVSGPCVLIGGPIDGVWYHWLASWCARIAIFRRLRPDLFYDSDVRLLVCRSADHAQFKESLLAMGLPESRIVFVNQDQDFLLEDAIIVSFPDQRYLYPEVVKYIVSDLKDSFGLSDVALKPNGRRLFASRQGLHGAKRKVSNWHEILPVLEKFQFEIVELGKECAESQVRMFAEAEYVLGVHGSDLANLMFCNPKATALVIENERNIYYGISKSLELLCKTFNVNYETIIVEEFINPDQDYSRFHEVHNRDVVVDPEKLTARLIEIGCDLIDSDSL